MANRSRLHRTQVTACYTRVIVVLAIAFCAQGCATPFHASPTEGTAVHRGDYAHLVFLASGCLECPAGAGDPDFQMQLIRALGESRDPNGIRGLLYMLNRPDSNYYCVAAAMALGRIGAPVAFLPLKEAIDQGRLGLADGVTAMGLLAGSAGNEEALHYVVAVLKKSQDVEGRRAAAWILLLRSPEAMQALEGAAHSDLSMRVRVTAACVATGRGSKQDYWPLLEEATRSKDAEVRLEVAKDLCVTLEEEHTTLLLLRLLTDEDLRVAAAAWEPLEKALGEGRETAKGLRVDYGWPPRSVEEGREMAETYRKAWNASHRK